MPTSERATFRIGGFGVTVSKGSAELVMRPMCYSTSTSKQQTSSTVHDLWERSALKHMKEILLLEQPTHDDFHG